MASARFNLRTKLILGSALILAPMLILLLANYQSAYEIQKNQVLSDQLRTAQVVAVTIDDAFDQAKALANSYASDPIVLSFDSARINSHLARLAPIYPQYYNPVGVFDVNGNQIAAAVRHGPINIADRPWFQEAMRTGEPAMSGVTPSIVTAKPIVVVVVPMIDSVGNRLGATTSTLSLDYYSNTLQSVQRAPEQNIFLTDKNGILAFHTGRTNIGWEERDVSWFPPIQTAMAGGQFQSDRTSGIFGGERMIVAIPTPRYGWVVGVSIPVDVALAPVNESQRNAILIFIVVVVLTVGLMLLVAEFLVRPLKLIAQAAVAFGKGHVKRRVNVKTGDEIEELASAFNTMADEVQRALQLRDDFLSVASHELRTPLTVIKGYSQWLLTKETAENKRKVLGTIVKQVDRIGELLDEMLTVSELRAGRVELHKQQMDISALANEVVDRMRTVSEKHSIRFLGNGPYIVNADRNQMEVVLVNLVDNAIRYSPAGGEIDVTVTGEDGNVVVSVTDRGMGIPEEKQKHVFEQFFQLQPAIAGFGGMGLGLYISKQIIERHGGRIWFESKPGVGSTFYFSLPLISTR